MKLIDILVEELPNLGGWPENAARLAQDPDGDIQMLSNRRAYLCLAGWAGDGRDDFYGQYAARKIEPLASDYTTAIITREQYEAALAAKNDGWIAWGGGKCPLHNGAIVDVKLRNGRTEYAQKALSTEGYASYPFWRNDGAGGDIIAYRLHQTQKAELVSVGLVDKSIDDACRVEEDLNDCIGQAPVTQWNGEGLPPVGCFCEVEDLDGMLVYGQGESGEVIAHVENTAVIRMSYGLGCFEARFLRPLRTEADKKRDAMVNDMVETIFYYYGNPKGAEGYIGLAERIIEAIEIGKIPGVKLEG